MIGVTGSTSGIGHAVLAVARAKGVEVVALGRSGAPEERPYDLFNPVDPESLRDLDAVVHLAWSWDAEPGANVKAGRGLVDACAARGIRPVLLSTFSAFAAASSYGTDKRVLEHRFAEVGGASVRAGLIWGGELAGIVATLAKLARLPVVAPRLRPDPVMRHSNESDLADTLLTVALAERPDGTLLAASREPVSLADLTAQLRGGGPGVPVPVPTGLLAALAAIVEWLHVPLPFRRDSLSAVRPGRQRTENLDDFAWVPGFQGTAALLRWAAAVS